MTFAERLEARGEARGMEKGIKIIALKLLQKETMPLSVIAELTGLTLKELRVLQKEKGIPH